MPDWEQIEKAAAESPAVARESLVYATDLVSIFPEHIGQVAKLNLAYDSLEARDWLLRAPAREVHDVACLVDLARRLVTDRVVRWRRGDEVLVLSPETVRAETTLTLRRLGPGRWGLMDDASVGTREARDLLPHLDNPVLTGRAAPNCTGHYLCSGEVIGFLFAGEDARPPRSFPVPSDAESLIVYRNVVQKVLAQHGVRYDSDKAGPVLATPVLAARGELSDEFFDTLQRVLGDAFVRKVFAAFGREPRVDLGLDVVDTSDVTRVCRSFANLELTAMADDKVLVAQLSVLMFLRTFPRAPRCYYAQHVHVGSRPLEPLVLKAEEPLQLVTFDYNVQAWSNQLAFGCVFVDEERKQVVYYDSQRSATTRAALEAARPRGFEFQDATPEGTAAGTGLVFCVFAQLFDARWPFPHPDTLESDARRLAHAVLRTYKTRARRRLAPLAAHSRSGRADPAMVVRTPTFAGKLHRRHSG